MRYKNGFKSDFLLIFTSFIWGFAFVAQREAMNSLGPFYYNGIRFFLGATFLIPFLRRGKNTDKGQNRNFSSFLPIFPVGLILFIASNLQQIGLVYTTAGKAGFITGLYVILVPILGLFFKKKTPFFTWGGALIAVIGMYFLSIKSGFAIQKGDLYVLLGAFVWAVHVLYIGWLTSKFNSLVIAIIQFYLCSLFSFVTAFFLETVSFQAIYQAIIPILYGGILSVGVAYTLQIIAQKKAHPSHAAIILSLESVFAVIGGVIILKETMSLKEWTGCFLMFSGMIISQIPQIIPGLMKTGGQNQ